MGVARSLAEKAAAMQYADLPLEAVHWSRVAVLDTVGVALAGALEGAPRIVADVLGAGAEQGEGPCAVWGTRLRTSALDAALINGTAAHALDFDNTSNTLAGHMTACMIPALIAAAEAHGGTGRDVLLAHAAGFEVGARLGHGLNFHHHQKGWHPTSTLGVFAVAAACARLLGLTVEQTETALALSTSLAAGTKANFGTMTKPFHAGQCARNGLMAALLARKGFTANAEAFEHKQGFFNLYNGAGNYSIERILESWGAPLDVVAPGACYKQYPSCAGTHQVIDATLPLTREHGLFDPASIAKVETWTSKHRLPHTDRADPRTPLEAKFSVQYCVTRALLDGKIVFEQFEGDAPMDACVRGVLPRVQSATYAEDEFPGNPNGAIVKVTLNDGRVLTSRIERALGRTSANPIPFDQLQAKFENCASRVLTPQAAAEVCRRIDTFEDVTSMREFTAMLVPAVATQQLQRRSA